MKENFIKVFASAVIAGLTAYLHALTIPILVLLGVMIGDYISGMIKAWITRELNSRIGLIGIIKKLAYLLVVCVGMTVDWIIASGLTQVGITYQNNFYVALTVTIWLIINEIISILENLSVIGVPLPVFLTKLIKKLKITVESENQEKLK